MTTESPPTSDLQFLDTTGMPIDGPLEWITCWLALPGEASAWERYQVVLNGRTLPLSLRALSTLGTTLVAEVPRLGPGHYAVRVLHPGSDQTETITVLPRKIGPRAMIRMVEDLQTRLPVSIAVGLQRLGALTTVHLRPPAEVTRAQEIARLRRAVVGTRERAGLLVILADLSLAPHSVLRTEEAWVRAEQARRPDPARLVTALAREDNRGAHGLPLRVIDTRVQPTFDVYENQLVALYCHLVLRRLKRIVQAGPADAAAREAVDLWTRLRIARRRAKFLDSVRLPTNLPNRVTMVLLRRPPYRAVQKGYRELLRSPFVTLDEPKLDVPLDSLPTLYQTWGTLQVIDAVLEVAADLGYTIVGSTLLRQEPGELHARVLADGRAALSLMHPDTGTRVEVIPERAYLPRHAGLHSITYEQRPDLAVGVTYPGQQPHVYLFDPKYKQEGDVGGSWARPVKGDIDKMHAYRDAVRDDDGARAVRYAAILFPGDPERYPRHAAVPDVEALHAYPGDEGTLRERLITVLSTGLQPLSPQPPAGCDRRDNREEIWEDLLPPQ